MAKNRAFYAIAVLASAGMLTTGCREKENKYGKAPAEPTSSVTVGPVTVESAYGSGTGTGLGGYSSGIGGTGMDSGKDTLKSLDTAKAKTHAKGKKKTKRHSADTVSIDKGVDSTHTPATGPGTPGGTGGSGTGSDAGGAGLPGPNSGLGPGAGPGGSGMPSGSGY